MFVLYFFDLPQMIDGRVGAHYLHFPPVDFLVRVIAFLELSLHLAIRLLVLFYLLEVAFERVQLDLFILQHLLMLQPHLLEAIFNHLFLLQQLLVLTAF